MTHLCSWCGKVIASDEATVSDEDGRIRHEYCATLADEYQACPVCGRMFLSDQGQWRTVTFIHTPKSGAQEWKHYTDLYCSDLCYLKIIPACMLGRA